MINRFRLGELLDEAMEDPFHDGGEPRITARHRLLLYAIAAFFLVFLLWAGIAKIDEVSRAQGRVVPSSIADKVMPEQPARVDEVAVSVGQKVKEGQLLLKLYPIVPQMDSATAESRYYALLAKQIRLQAEAEALTEPKFTKEVIAKAPKAVENEKQTFSSNLSRNAAQLDTLKQQASQRQNELEQIEQQIKDTSNTAGLAAREVGILAPLVREGAASQRDLVKAQQGLSSTQSELNRLRNAKPTAEGAIREAQSRITEFNATIRSDAQAALSQLESEIRPLQSAVLAARGELPAIEVKAPREGLIQSVSITKGSVVQPGQQAPMIEIVPDTGILLIEARLRPADVAFIRPGQAASIKITAYDFSIYGGFDAKVEDISPDTITDEKGESYYRVRLSTNRNCLIDKNEKCRVGADGKPLAITPGMTAQVDILTNRRTILHYLLKPFIKASQNALTER